MPSIQNTVHTFNTPEAALAYVKTLRVMPVAYGRYANSERSFEVHHDSLDLSDITWRVYEIECAEDRTWFAKHGHKAWVQRTLKAFQRQTNSWL